MEFGHFQERQRRHIRKKKYGDIFFFFFFVPMYIYFLYIHTHTRTFSLEYTNEIPCTNFCVLREEEEMLFPCEFATKTTESVLKYNVHIVKYT